MEGLCIFSFPGVDGGSKSRHDKDRAVHPKCWKRPKTENTVPSYCLTAFRFP